MKKIILLFISLFVSGCTKVLFATANAPSLSYDGEIYQDIQYGTLSRQSLDIFVPSLAKEQDLPVIVFYHGGRWTFGSKDQYKFVGMSLSKLGYVVVLPNTRLHPEVKFPTFIEDAASSLAWIHENIHQYKGSDQLFVSGHSSGAHIAAMLTVDPQYLNNVGLSNKIISAFAGLAGPYDFEPETNDLKDIFGPPENYPKMVVSNFVAGDEAPMLLMHSLDDETVHIRNLQKLEDKILAKNGQVKTVLYENGGHAGMVAALSWANLSSLPVKQDIDDFFKSHIEKQAP